MTAPRQTRQRTAVSALMDELAEFRSAQEIHDLLKARGEQVGLTTVYRSLQSLAASGDVDFLVTDDGETVYRRCSTQHHHHLVCRECGATVEVSGPAVERLMASQIDEVVVTNTIPLSDEAKACAKIRQLSVAFLFAETMRRISDGESVTSLFAEQNSNF